jgi:UDP-GlcNAc:undecaprenyl-phosphate/decaprenyl-phosphate GlcNAc-1-phosphate transferase
MDLLLPLILAAVVTVALIPALERRAGALHVLDAPGDRKVHDRPVARVGGIAMAAGAALAFALWLPLDRTGIAYLAGAALVFVFGVWDDRRDLRPLVKLAAQFAAACIVVWGGGIVVGTINLSTQVQLPAAMAVPLTILFLVGTTNAINLADGLDGLAGGTAFLCFAAIAALAIFHDVPFVLVVTFVLMGSLLGFLRFNSYPARIFMGDGGSQWLGFTAGVAAVALTQDPAVPYSAALPLLLLGLPIIDTLMVMVRRISLGQSPFVADKRHLHHRLLKAGFTHAQSVLVIYAAQAGLFLLAWAMRYQSDLAIVAVFAAVVLLIGGLLLFGEARWRRHEAAVEAGTIQAHVGGPHVPERVERISLLLQAWVSPVAFACVALYFLGVVVDSTRVSVDIAWLALALAAILLASTWGFGYSGVLKRIAHGAMFVAASLFVYLDHQEPEKIAAFVRLKWILFPLLIAAVVLRMRFWKERRFEVTTLDVLVVFLALTLPNLPGLQQAPGNVGLSVAKLLAVYYALEMLVWHTDRVRRLTWGATGLALALLSVLTLTG